jgi:hypothetical protein
MVYSSTLLVRLYRQVRLQSSGIRISWFQTVSLGLYSDFIKLVRKKSTCSFAEQPSHRRCCPYAIYTRVTAFPVKKAARWDQTIKKNEQERRCSRHSH